MMESITKYELVTTLEFQLVTESSLPDWIVRLDLYKTKKNKEVLYYPRIFSRELYMISRPVSSAMTPDTDTSFVASSSTLASPAASSCVAT